MQSIRPFTLQLHRDDRVITVYTGVPYRGVTSLLSINYVHANCQQDNIVTLHSGVAHEHHLHYGIDTDERPRA